MNRGAGYDATLTLGDAVTGMTGLTLYGGLSNISEEGLNNDGDHEERTIAATINNHPRLSSINGNFDILD